jgi:hypothetical protein
MLDATAAVLRSTRLTTGVIRRFEAFLAERRVAVNKEPQRVKVSGAVRLLLAVYRKQFGCITRALSDPSYACTRRADGTCCRAVPRRKVG